MSITADLIRGNTDTIILSQLLDKDSYGYEINKAIKNITHDGYELKEATLYTAFKRLEDAGCISSYWGDENVGARRKYYKITNNGLLKTKELEGQWIQFYRSINKILGITEKGE